MKNLKQSEKEKKIFKKTLHLSHFEEFKKASNTNIKTQTECYFSINFLLPLDMEVIEESLRQKPEVFLSLFRNKKMSLNN